MEPRSQRSPLTAAATIAAVTLVAGLFGLLAWRVATTGNGLATALAARTVADGLRQMQQQVRHRPDVTASSSSRCTKVAPVTVRTG